VYWLAVLYSAKEGVRDILSEIFRVTLNGKFQEKQADHTHTTVSGIHIE